MDWESTNRGARRGLRGLRPTAAIVAAVAAWAGGTGSQAATIPVAVTGDSAPGTGGGTFSSFGPTPALNGSGQAAFIAGLTGTTNASTQGIFRGDGAALAAIARDKQSAPGTGGGTFIGFNTPALNGSGQAAFLANLTGTTNASTSGIFRGDGTALPAIARDKQSAPGTGGGTFTGLGTPALNGSGQAAFLATLTGTTNASTQGIFRGDGTVLAAIARDQQSAPGTGGGTFTGLGTPALNGSGQAAFLATLTGTTNGSIRGIFRGDGTALAAIARNQQSAPGTGGGTFSTLFSSPALNGSGQAAFRGFLTGTTDASTQGVFRGDGTALAAIARNQQSAPGTGGGTFSGFANPALNGSGQAAFWASLTGTTDASNQGIFRGDGTAVVAMARTRQSAPGTGGGTFTTLGTPALNGSGQAAFLATLTGTSEGTANDSGLFLSDGPERIEVAREGQALGGSTIVGVSFAGGVDEGGRSGLNDFGQVAYWATLADGRQAIAVFTPDLHYRSTAAGTWDTSDNWTVGLTPAVVHDVFIDPALGLTVSGPSNSPTIKSLRVGATSAGTAVLDLRAGGNLSVAETVTVDGSGRIEQSTGTLVAGSVANSGLIRQTGGTISGSVTNHAGGEIQLASSTAQIAGSGLTNNGLLNGTGRIAAPLTNAPTGEVRATGNERLVFTAARNSSAGAINLVNGGTAEFTGQLTNTGTAGGRGTLIARGGLRSSGQLQFSGGFSDVFGNVTNLGTAAPGGTGPNGSMVITGGATVTAFNDLRNESTNAIRVTKQGTVSSSLTVFGTFSGNINVTGGGAVFLEGPVSPGFSPFQAVIAGDLTFGSASSTLFEVGGRTPGAGPPTDPNNGYDQFIVSGTATLGGTFNLTTINNFDPVHGDFFDLIIASDIVDGGVSYAGLTMADGDRFVPSLIDGPTTDVLRMTVVAVPEPTGAAMLLVGCGLLNSMRRRRGRGRITSVRA